MKGFIGFTKRNLLIYFKDIYGVIFSLLTSLIVFVLYLLFLKGSFVDAINGAMNGLEEIVSTGDIEMFVNGILLVGIIGSALITVPYNCLQTIIKDREGKVDYDISATPLKRWQIILSYFLAAVISAFIITSLILSIGLIVLSAMGDLHMTAAMILAAYGVILLGAFSATACFMILIMGIKNASTGAAFFGIISAASGFVIGAYIPISQFSSPVRTVCNLFPASHITVLFRNLMLNGILDSVNTSIGGLDNGVFAEELKRIFSFKADLFGSSLSAGNMLTYVAAATLICITAMTLIYGKIYKRR